jgi:hypothetical protein
VDDWIIQFFFEEFSRRPDGNLNMEAGRKAGILHIPMSGEAYAWILANYPESRRAGGLNFP